MRAVKGFELCPGIKLGKGQPLLFIAGPCQIESYEHCLKIAKYLKQICTNHGVNLIFKASYDKANRSSKHSKRGIGKQAGLEILAAIRSETGLAVLTDVHEASDVQEVAAKVDILQTPAFLCRQTDLLMAVGASGRPVNIKKGQFLAPEDMRFAAEKVAAGGNQKILLCERGTCFGYRDLIVDMRSLVQMREIGYPVIFDATHSVQNMGGLGGQSGGSREFVRPLVRAALATGIDGLFLECHDNPENAPSDGAVMLRLEELEPILIEAKAIIAATTVN